MGDLAEHLGKRMQKQNVEKYTQTAGFHTQIMSGRILLCLHKIEKK